MKMFQGDIRIAEGQTVNPEAFVPHPSGLLIPEPEAPLLPPRLQRRVDEAHADGKIAPYIHFPRPIQRRELYTFAKDTTEYVHDNGIEAMALVDTSARPFAAAFKTYWDSKYPDEGSSPQVFFVNPTGFRYGLEQSDRDESPSEKLNREHPFLAGYKDAPVLLFDTCIHSGQTAMALMEIFADAGFEDLRFGVVINHDNKSNIEPDVVLTKKPPYNYCYPFEEEFAVRQNWQTLFSTVISENVRRHSRVHQMRAEIQRIVCEGYLSELQGEKPHTRGGAFSGLRDRFADRG